MNAASPTLQGPTDAPAARAGAGGAAKGQIRAHTGLRGIAALLVVGYHQEFGPFYKLPFEISTNVFRRSYLMVDLFFILSGFIISYVYCADRKEPMSPAATKSFLFTRFARIYPLHFVSAVFMLLFAIASTTFLALTGHHYDALNARDLTQWLLQLVLLNAWKPGYDAWNVPSWSISAEMFAYLLFPAIVAAHVLRGRLSRATLLMISVGFYFYIAATSRSLDIIAGLAPLRCIAGFGLGMIVYHYRAQILRASDPLLSAVQVTALLWACLGLAYKVNDPLIIPAFLMIVASTWVDRGIVAKLLSLRPFQWLGEISYSVYLLHVPLGSTLWFFWSRSAPRLGVNPPVGRVMWLVIVFAAVLIGSTLSYHGIEVPARRGLMRWWGARNQPAQGALIPAP
ncbi:MAG: acyltransferase family protein [Sphingomicrobium sp.]